MKFVENVLDAACKVNELGSTCAKTSVTLVRAASLFVSHHDIEIMYDIVYLNIPV